MNSTFAKSRKFALIANRFAGFGASVTFGAMSILVIMQVLSRSFFGYSFQWAEELARYFFIWSTMLASACAVYFKMHVGVDLIVNRLNCKNKKAVTVIAQVLLIFALLIMIYAGSFQTWNTALSGQTATSFPVSAAVLYLAVPVSGLLMLLYAVLQLIELVSPSSSDCVRHDDSEISAQGIKN